MQLTTMIHAAPSAAGWRRRCRWWRRRCGGSTSGSARRARVGETRNRPDKSQWGARGRPGVEIIRSLRLTVLVFDIESLTAWPRSWPTGAPQTRRSGRSLSKGTTSLPKGALGTKTLLKRTNWWSTNLFEERSALLRIQYGCVRHSNIWYFKLCLIYTSLLRNQEFSFKYIIITCCLCNLHFNVVRYCCVLICMGRLRNQELRFEYIISLHDVCKTHLIFNYALMHQHRVYFVWLDSL